MQMQSICICFFAVIIAIMLHCRFCNRTFTVKVWNCGRESAKVYEKSMVCIRGGSVRGGISGGMQRYKSQWQNTKWETSGFGHL